MAFYYYLLDFLDQGFIYFPIVQNSKFSFNLNIALDRKILLKYFGKFVY